MKLCSKTVCFLLISQTMHVFLGSFSVSLACVLQSLTFICSWGVFLPSKIKSVVISVKTFRMQFYIIFHCSLKSNKWKRVKTNALLGKCKKKKKKGHFSSFKHQTVFHTKKHVGTLFLENYFQKAENSRTAINGGHVKFRCFPHY